MEKVYTTGLFLDTREVLLQIRVSVGEAVGEKLLVVSKLKCVGKTMSIHSLEKPWIISLVLVCVVADILTYSMPSHILFVLELL